MLYIRPVEKTDLDDLLELSVKAGKGMTSLPNDAEALLQSIEKSMDSFSRTHGEPDDYFLLVMVDTDKNKVVGTAGVHARTGARQAFYAYRILSLTHHSHSLDKQIRTEMLQLSNDYTDCSEVGTLFLDPAYRGNGHWLSRSRYLLMGQFPQRFASHVIAEMRGWVDAEGRSPFWEAIGRHFFEMDFEEADKLCGVGSNQFITELMPKHPIYTQLLPDEAREVIGKPNDDGRRAKELLEEEGFEYDKVVDIFDAGPLLRARISRIRSICNIQTAQVASSLNKQTEPQDGLAIISNGRMPEFRVACRPCSSSDDKTVALEADTMAALGVKPGDAVHFIPMK